MRELDWETYLEDRSVRGAYERLRKLATAKGKAIRLHPLGITAVENPFWCPSANCHHIFIDAEMETVRHTLVHELLHGILLEEGYSRIGGVLPTCVHPVLNNELEHPEIFRRMEHVHGLDMRPYWNRWSVILPENLGFMRERAAIDPYIGYVHFARVFSWFAFPEDMHRFLEDFRQFSPMVHDAVAMAYAESAAVGFHDAQVQRESLAVFRMHSLRYCEQNLPDDSYGQDMTDCVRECFVRPHCLVVDSRSDENLLAALRLEHGLED